jgi:hypothetical protein
MKPIDNATAELTGVRRSLYQCLSPWRDALFELCDAALCSPAPVGSVPSLSLEPEFRRSHGSLYKALAEGDVDDGRLRELLVDRRPKDWPLVFAVDASTWACCDAECSPERGFHYSASKHSAGQPIVAGGPTSGSASWTGRRTAGPPRSTPSASHRPWIQQPPPSTR